MLKGDTHDREPVLSFWIRHERSESAEGHDALLPTGWKVLHDQNTVILVRRALVALLARNIETLNLSFALYRNRIDGEFGPTAYSTWTVVHDKEVALAI